MHQITERCSRSLIGLVTLIHTRVRFLGSHLPACRYMTEFGHKSVHSYRYRVRKTDKWEKVRNKQLGGGGEVAWASNMTNNCIKACCITIFCPFTATLNAVECSHYLQPLIASLKHIHSFTGLFHTAVIYFLAN